MWRLLCILGFALIVCGAAHSQPTIEVPRAGRPPDFSNIVGQYERPRVTAAPTNVHVEQAIRLEIRITGAGPEAQEPDRKYIRKLLPAAFESDFYVEELRNDHRVMRKEKTWLFVFQLKPRHTRVDAIDDIKLVTYDPSIASKNKFISQYADRIAITVSPKPDKPPPTVIEDVAAPASFYEIRSMPVLRSDVPVAIAAWHVAVFLVLPPVVCLMGVMGYRRIRPSDLARIHRFRGEAARRALAQLECRGEPAWTVVARYLHERFGFAASDAAPAEVAGFLHRRGFARSLSQDARAFFQTCDAARFMPDAAADASRLSAAAAALIQALEADPCAR